MALSNNLSLDSIEKTLRALVDARDALVTRFGALDRKEYSEAEMRVTASWAQDRMREDEALNNTLAALSNEMLRLVKWRDSLQKVATERK